MRNSEHMTRAEVEQRIKGVLEAAGIDCLITGRLTARFPDGAACCYVPVQIEANGMAYQRRQ
jgi:hypothetical protein